jgi:hypothetical protein
MMLRATIFLFSAALAFGATAHAAGIQGCPAWPNAEKNLKLHNYKVASLTPSGIGHAISYLKHAKPGSHIAENSNVTGHYAYTTFYQFVADGKAVGGMPADKAMVVLYDAHGDCVAQVGGTIEKLRAVLDGTASEFANSVAK